MSRRSEADGEESLRLDITESAAGRVAGRNSENKKKLNGVTACTVSAPAAGAVDEAEGENHSNRVTDFVRENRAIRAEELNGQPETRGSGQGAEEFAFQRLQAFVEDFKTPSIPTAESESNLQEQEDEILALDSIYGEDFKRLNNEHKSYPSFMISVRVEIPTSLTVVAEFSSTSGPLEASVAEDSLVTNESPLTSTTCRSQPDGRRLITVQALPPIQLVFTLPPSYPSQSPPLYALYASWINSENLSRFCTSLDTIWNDRQNEVVLYSWIDWLQNQSLPLLEASEKLELGPYGVDGTICRRKESDLRAVSGCWSFNSDIAGLLQYDEERKSEEFCKSLHTCNICFIEQAGKEFATMPCQHIFCWSCMKTYASVHVNEGSVNKIRCPDTTCRHSIPPFILKELLDQCAFERWEDLVLKKSLDAMEDIVYCPRCEMVCIEEEDHFVQCGDCFFSFCGLCRQSWHVGQECISPESRLLLLQGRRNVGSGEEQRRKEKELINELMNLQYVRREAKQCPKCKMAISKTEGCNKMACTNCGEYFCFRCGKGINGYEHFRDGSCELFDAQSLRWQPQLEPQLLAEQQQVQLQLWPELGRTCPICRRLNAKIGNNNYIRCLSCGRSYCALCKKIVQRYTEHYGFGTSKCRQHTAD